MLVSYLTFAAVAFFLEASSVGAVPSPNQLNPRLGSEGVQRRSPRMPHSKDGHLPDYTHPHIATFTLTVTETVVNPSKSLVVTSFTEVVTRREPQTPPPWAQSGSWPNQPPPSNWGGPHGPPQSMSSAVGSMPTVASSSPTADDGSSSTKSRRPAATSRTHNSASSQTSKDTTSHSTKPNTSKSSTPLAKPSSDQHSQPGVAKTSGSSTTTHASSPSSKHSSTLSASYATSKGSQSGLSKTTIISIAVVVPIVALLIAGIFLYCRKRRHGTKVSSSRFSGPGYEPPDDPMGIAYGGIREFGPSDGSPDLTGARASLGADLPGLAPPPRLPTQPSTQIRSQGNVGSSIPPTSPPKNSPGTSSPQMTQKQSAPLVSAWRRAQDVLKQSRAVTSQSSLVYPGIMDSYEDSIAPNNSTPRGNSSVFASSASIDHQEDDPQPQPNSERARLTHPALRRGSLDSRMAPRTPKTPHFSWFDFGSSRSSPGRSRSSPRPSPHNYEQVLPDPSDTDSSYQDVDLRSPYQPPADLYHQIAYQIPGVSNRSPDQAFQSHSGVIRHTRNNTTSPVAQNSTRTGTNTIFVPSPSNSRPCSDAYSVHIPPTAPLAVPVRATARSRAGRFTDRAFWIRTSQPTTPKKR